MMIDLRMATADTLADDVSAGTLAILLITRPEIERGSVGDVVDRLMAMTDSAATTSNLAGSVIVQVDGYNDDPRELSEIKEVRDFFLAIDAQWPYWAHFLNTSLTDAFNLLISLLLGSLKLILRGPGSEPWLRNLIDSLYKAIRSGVENGRLDGEAWTQRKEALQELLDVPETALAWKYLNKAVHDGDGEDPEIGIVRQIVASLTKLSASFGN